MMRPFFPGSSAQASPMALIASPTRELAIQTDKALFAKLGFFFVANTQTQNEHSDVCSRVGSG